MMSDADLYRLEENFGTGDLVRAIVRIDNVRTMIEPPHEDGVAGVRDDLVRLHEQARRVIDARARGEAEAMFELAQSINDRVNEMNRSLETVQAILSQLTDLYPESLIE